jgi:hypothetical protein
VIRGNEQSTQYNKYGRGSRGGGYRGSRGGGERGAYNNPRYEGGRSGGGDRGDFKYNRGGSDRPDREGYQGRSGRGDTDFKYGGARGGDGEDRDHRRGGDRDRGGRGGRGSRGGRGGYDRDNESSRGGGFGNNFRGGRDRGGDRVDRFNEPSPFIGVLTSKGSALVKKQAENEEQDRRNENGEKKQVKNEGLFAKDNNPNTEISRIEKNQNDSDFIQQDMGKLLPDYNPTTGHTTGPVSQANLGTNTDNMLEGANQDDENSAEHIEWDRVTEEMEEDWKEYDASMKARLAKRESRQRSDDQIAKDKGLWKSEEIVARGMEDALILRKKEGYPKRNTKGGELMNKLSVNQTAGGQRGSHVGGNDRDVRSGSGHDGPEWNTAPNRGERGGKRDRDYNDNLRHQENDGPKGDDRHGGDDPRDGFMGGDRGNKDFVFRQNNNNSGNRGPRDDHRNQNSEGFRNKDLQMGGGGRNDSLFEGHPKAERKPSDGSWNQSNPGYGGGSNVQGSGQYGHGPNSGSRAGYRVGSQGEHGEKNQSERPPRNAPDAEGRSQNYNAQRPGSGRNYHNDGPNEGHRGVQGGNPNYNSHRGGNQGQSSGYYNANNADRRGGYNSHQGAQRQGYNTMSRGGNDNQGYTNTMSRGGERQNQDQRPENNDRRDNETPSAPQRNHQELERAKQDYDSPASGGYNAGPNNNESRTDRNRDAYDSPHKDGNTTGHNSSHQGNNPKSVNHGNGPRDYNQDSANNQSEGYDSRPPRQEGSNNYRGDRESGDRNNTGTLNRGTGFSIQNNQSNQDRDYATDRNPRRDSEGQNYDSNSNNAGERQTQAYSNPNYQGNNPNYKGRGGSTMYRGGRGGSNNYHNSRGGSNRDNYNPTRGNRADSYNQGYNSGYGGSKNEVVYDLKGSDAEGAHHKSGDGEFQTVLRDQKSGKGSQKNDSGDHKKDISKDGLNESKNDGASKGKDSESANYVQKGSAKGGSKSNLDESNTSETRYETRDRDRNTGGHNNNRRGQNSDNYRGNNRNNNYNSNYKGNSNQNNTNNENLDNSEEGYVNTGQRNTDNYHGNNRNDNYRGNNPHYHRGGETTTHRGEGRGGYQGNNRTDNYNRDNRGGYRGRGNFHDRGGRGGNSYNNRGGYNNSVIFIQAKDFRGLIIIAKTGNLCRKTGMLPIKKSTIETLVRATREAPTKDTRMSIGLTVQMMTSNARTKKAKCSLRTQTHFRS